MLILEEILKKRPLKNWYNSYSLLEYLSKITLFYRFCCFNKNDKASPILSEGNQMLVLMRAFGDGKRGFEAEIVSGNCLSKLYLDMRYCSFNSVLKYFNVVIII